MVDSSSSLATLVSASTLVQGGVADWLHECHWKYEALWGSMGQYGALTGGKAVCQLLL